MIAYTNHSVLFDKIINRVWNKKNSIWKYIPLAQHTKNKLGKIDMDQPKLQHLLSVALGSVDVCTFKDSIRQEDAEQIMLWAKKSRAHTFNYLGSGWTQLSPMAWNVDFKSGYEWPQGRFYRSYHQPSSSINSDIKVVWELSRCHHLLWLAEAYMLTGDREYASEVVWQIDHWIDNNPLMYSVNWTCAMDVAFRAINWMYALNMIMSSGVVTDELCRKVYISLFEHGFFISNNLEKNIPYSGNHYLSDLVGMLFISSVFPKNRSARRWNIFALREFCYEVDNQIGPNGVHYENSVSYHRLVTELFVAAYSLLARQHHKVANRVRDKIGSMLDFVSAYIKPNGLSPVIGDNDDGRLLPFVPRDFRDHRYLLDFGETLFGKSYSNGYGDSVESNVMSAQITRRALERVGHKKNEFLCPEAGYAIVKSDAAYLIASNTPFSLKRKMGTGVFVGTHTHSDLLSFELSVLGSDVIVDSGSFVYTSDKEARNKFRSTEMHNTVVVDSQSQHGMSNSKMFIMRADTNNHILHISTNLEQLSIVGSYDKIVADSTLHHNRQFVIANNSLVITDDLSFAGDHLIEMFFHFAPGITLQRNGDGVIVETEKFRILIESDKDAHYDIISSETSMSYGTKATNQVLKISSTMHSIKQLETKIVWEPQKLH